MDYNANVFSFYRVCLYHALPGALLGFMIEHATRKLTTQYQLTAIQAFGVQLFMAIGVLYVVEHYISSRYAAEWQITTPGFIFVAFFFTMQPSLYLSAEHALYNLGLDTPASNTK